MDMNHLMTQMMTSISEVMETMFYIPVEPREIESIETSGFLDVQEIQACRITFSGPFSGKIYLLLPQSLLTVITENFMGESQEHLTAEHLTGTLMEILNMMAGNTFSKIDQSSSFGLGVPETGEQFIDELCRGKGGSLSPDKNLSGNSIIIDTMDGPMAAAVQLD